MLWTNYEIEHRFSELNYPRSEIIEFVKWFRDEKAQTWASVCAKKDAHIAELEADYSAAREAELASYDCVNELQRHDAVLRERIAELEAERDKWKGIIDHLREAGVIT